MSTTNIIEISGQSDDTLYPTNELGDTNKLFTSDPVVAKLSKIVCRQLQKEKERLKQKKAANAYTTIFTCVLCVIMVVIIVTKLLEDGARTQLYDSNSTYSLPPKVYENQKRPASFKSVLQLIKSANPKFQTRTTLPKTSLKNSVTELSVHNQTITQENKMNFNTTTEDTNDIPTVQPLLPLLHVPSSGDLNANNLYALSYFLIVLLIFKF